jgi:NitT/TauT family transport system permease protein
MHGAVFLSVDAKAERNRLARWWVRGLRTLAPLLLGGLMLVGWHVLSLGYPAFILPGPGMVFERFVEAAVTERLLFHAAVTLSEALPGLVIGTLGAFALGYPVAKLPLVDQLLSPLIVASQGVPFVAVAPLLFIWFGSGWLAKVIVCTLIVFFPIVINVIVGLRSVPPLWRDVFRAMRANARQQFWKLELPAALPHIFAGLRVGGTLSMVGAITGEFLSADRGLGFLVNVANGQYDTPLVMVCVLTMILCALMIYGGIRLLERSLRY